MQYEADSLLHSTTCHIKASWEIFDGRYALHVNRNDGKKRKIEKEGKINISTLIFFYTIYLATL